MSNLIVKIEQANESRGYFFNSEYIESSYKEIGDLFRACLKEYGRCVGKVFVEESRNGETNPKAIGWCFEQLRKYSDSKDKFKCVTWISVLEDWPIRQPPIVKYKTL